MCNSKNLAIISKWRNKGLFIIYGLGVLGMGDGVEHEILREDHLFFGNLPTREPKYFKARVTHFPACFGQQAYLGTRHYPI